MHQPSTFQVYNASAGSGKTFTLVKEYLKILLTSEDIFKFQKVLAITFTNKAAGEMKERVMHNLHDFSEGIDNDLLAQIIKETSLDVTVIQKRSAKILEAVLQNYSAFAITTIDSFTHKIIKNFAYDLGLTLNFEVEMDGPSLLRQAVDVLISKIGTDKELTNLLIDFSLSKIDADKSWDISRDLHNFSKILLNEEDTKHFRKLANKSIQDFFELKARLSEVNSTIEALFSNIGEEALLLIKNNNLQFSDFANSGEVPKHFEKLTKLKLLKHTDLKFDGRINKNFESDKKLYAAKATIDTKDCIDDLYQDFKSLYQKSKNAYEQYYGAYLLNNLALKSIIPLAVLNNIHSELQNLKEENNIRLNAEFNQLISDNIKDQPAPFIYERIGQRFMHYFIDEMQDTSVLQWQNLIPLIDNALAQDASSLLLVGDGKQAIYRWRGGKAEQFINLGQDNYNPFQAPKEVKTLDTNYRSHAEVINFNNSFFQHTANFLQNKEYQQLFIEGNTQKENTKKGGCVSISFLEKLADKEEDKIKFPQKVLETIQELSQQYALNEICVLVRKKKDGVAVANYLSENGVTIVSSETLLLKNSSKINFIVNLLKAIHHPNDQETRFELLYFIHEHLQISESIHEFIGALVKEPLENFFTVLAEKGVYFDLNEFYQLPFYEKIEQIIRSFSLVRTSDAYVQFFLDVVLDQQRKGVDLQSFLEYWNEKQETLSIVAPENESAVNIMTIHKSKGLEFPVVIFPYDLEIYKTIDPKVWFDDLPEEVYGNFNELLINATSVIQNVNNKGSEIYQLQQEELELDNFNLLYVALTRAVEQLHIITEKYLLRNGAESTKHYSGIFINYLKTQKLWKDDQLVYTFGDTKRISEKKQKENTITIQDAFISTPWKDHNIVMLASSSKLWGTEQGKAIDYGNLVHELMAKIQTVSDVDNVIKLAIQQGEIPQNKKDDITTIVSKIINHNKLQDYFSEDVTVYNEREIVTADNQIIIPDRLVFQGDDVIVIDYKTGKPDKKYHQQLLKYAHVLKTIGYSVSKKILVYIDNEIIVEEV